MIKKFLCLIQPRVEGSVEIRSKDGSILSIALVSIALYRTDTIHPPSTKPGINAPKYVW
jgi:hypothetical protein